METLPRPTADAVHAPRSTATFQIAGGATVSQLLETGTELLIEQLQRPVRAVIVDTYTEDAGETYFAVVEAHEVLPTSDARVPLDDVLSRAYQGKAA